FIIRPFIALFCGIYGLLLFGVEYDDVKRVFSQCNMSGLKDDIFDECRLESAPLWNLNLKKWLNPEHDPMKTCNRSYIPWSRLAEDGRVELTRAYDKQSACRARAVLLKTEYRYEIGPWHDVGEKFVFENDIVEVECLALNQTVYNFVHYQIWDKPRSKTERKRGANKPSVHIIVLDSIGASHGRRAFEKTQSFLKKEFGAVEMLHMNKVGENSRPNGMAFLLGKLCMPLRRTMYGVPNQDADWNYTQFCKTYLDDKGFILKMFEEVR
ncbi:hypothetical protein PMAYCL1PPCAC_26150, partial [Pristionchus mayeri]